MPRLGYWQNCENAFTLHRIFNAFLIDQSNEFHVNLTKTVITMHFRMEFPDKIPISKMPSKRNLFPSNVINITFIHEY